MREIFLTREEPYKGATLLRHMVADRSAQRRIRRLQRIQHRHHRHRAFNRNRDLSIDLRQIS
jgi:hypothetical protein